MLKGIYSIFRLLFEIVTVFSFGYWGFQLRSLGSWRFLIGIGAAAAVVATWAIWGAPSAATRLQGTAHFILELAIYLVAAVCLYFSGQKQWAVAYGLLGIANTIVHHAWLPAI